MSFLKKVKELGGDLTEAAKEKAQRGKLELEVRRIQGKIDDEKGKIGVIVFDLIKDGSVVIANDDITGHISAIAALDEELAGKRKEIEALGEDDEDAEADPASAASA